MRLLPKTRKTTWICAVLIWFALAIFCWQGSPYRIVREWPVEPETLLFGFIQSEDSILFLPTQYAQGIIPEQLAPFQKFCKIDIWTGKVRELFQLKEEDSNGVIFIGGRWVGAYSQGTEKNEVILHDVVKDRTHQIATNPGKKPHTFVDSPDGRYLCFNDQKGGLAIIDLSEDEPKLIESRPGYPGFDTIISRGIGYSIAYTIDDQGQVFAIVGGGPDGQDSLIQFVELDRTWREILPFEKGERATSIARDREGMLVDGTRNAKNHPYHKIEPITGKKVETMNAFHELPRVSSGSWVNPWNLWLSRRMPSLGFGYIDEIIDYHRATGEDFVLIHASTASPRNLFLSLPALPDQAHPYVAVIDHDRIKIWNDPPRKSIKWFLTMWMSCGLPILAIAFWRNLSIRWRVVS